MAGDKQAQPFLIPLIGRDRLDSTVSSGQQNCKEVRTGRASNHSDVNAQKCPIVIQARERAAGFV
ncbi:MAG: hypothetical protein ACI8W8_003297 [Rhodothermales bacterium]|jgi:hypothetical protein